MSARGRWTRLALALAGLAGLAALSSCGRCGGTTPSPPAPPDGALGGGAPPLTLRTKKGGTDVTFLVVSDTHFGFGGIEAAHDRLVPKLNGIAGRAYPEKIGSVVGIPRGLLITGDLTEWGKPDEWEPFVKTYGLTGKEGKLGIPVFEVVGNHDKVSAHFVEERVAERHGGGRFYSWDWDDLHLVALGEAPDEEGLAFLSRDLAALARDIPIVLYFHLALGGPWSTGNWFAEGTLKSRLAKICEPYQVIAIFHGHHHFTEHYRWNGMDVWKPGAVKDGAHTFAVVHVTGDRMTVGSFDWENAVWADAFEKRLP